MKPRRNDGAGLRLSPLYCCMVCKTRQNRIFLYFFLRGSRGISSRPSFFCVNGYAA